MTGRTVSVAGVNHHLCMPRNVRRESTDESILVYDLADNMHACWVRVRESVSEWVSEIRMYNYADAREP